MDLILNKELKIKDVFYADTFIRRLAGYMFRKTPHYPAIIFYPCKDIHTFFMKFDIDLIFLDQDKRVVEIVFGVSRNKLIRSKENVVYTVEVPSGSVMDVSVGDVLILC
jgi:uncharacterized membrane protein (UPF0127 family)